MTRLIPLFCLGVLLASGCGLHVRELSRRPSVAWVRVVERGGSSVAVDLADLEAVGRTPLRVALRSTVIEESVTDVDRIAWGVAGTLLGLSVGATGVAFGAIQRDAEGGAAGLLGGAALIAAGVVALLTAHRRRRRVVPRDHELGFRVDGQRRRHALRLTSWHTPPRLRQIDRIVFDARTGRFTIVGGPSELRWRPR